jgi:hypothetical protein
MQIVDAREQRGNRRGGGLPRRAERRPTAP